MLIMMQPGATRSEIDQVVERIENLGFSAHEIPGAQRLAIGITGNEGAVSPARFEGLHGIHALIPVTKPYKLVDREAKGEDTVVSIGSQVSVGGKQLLTIAGPCSVESSEQLFSTARAVKAAGATALRGGAYKPRTSPYSFQGLKEEGLQLLADARQETGLPVITEVKDVETVSTVGRYADVLQIGARNMQNFSLLEAVGDQPRPVLLKRGLSATVEELLLAAEYIFNRGNQQIILCERGIRTFERITRNTLDLGAVVMLKRMTHLPVIVDPSHGMGVWYGVAPMALAAVAAGADGLMVEVHPNPPQALSDGPQSLLPRRFDKLMSDLRTVASVVGRTV